MFVPAGEPDLGPPGEEGNGPLERPGEVGVPGFELDGPGEVAAGLAVVALPEEDGADAEKGAGMVGVEIERPAAVDEGRIVFASPGGQVGQPGQRVGRARLELQGALEGRVPPRPGLCASKEGGP